jgi:hypothetical protein
MLGRGIGHLFKRLAAPDDGHVSHDKSIESGIDRLLYELGAEPYDPWGAPTYLERWAQEQRARLGSFGPLLVKMHQAVRDGLLQAPSRDLPQPNPEHVEAWERAREKPLAETAAHRASEAEAAAKAGERRRRGKQKGEN